MQARTALLLCTIFVLGFARPQGHDIRSAGPFGGMSRAPDGSVAGPQMGAQQRLQKFRGILAGELLNLRMRAA